MSPLYLILEVKISLPKVNKILRTQLLVRSLNKYRGRGVETGSCLRKGCKGLETHFKSLTYSSLVITLTAHSRR